MVGPADRYTSLPWVVAKLLEEMGLWEGLACVGNTGVSGEQRVTIGETKIEAIFATGRTASQRKVNKLDAETRGARRVGMERARGMWVR